MALRKALGLDGMVKGGWSVRQTAGVTTSHWLLGMMGAMVLLQGCNSATPTKEDVTLAAAPTAAMAAAPNSPSSAKEDPYLATGPIIVENQVDVLAQRDGMVKQILVDVGAPTRKGTLLVLLDDTELAAKRDAAEAQVHSSEADLKDWQAETKVAEVDFHRAQQMGKAGITTQEEVDHARYKFEGSQYEVEKAERNLENYKADLRVAEVELGKTRIEAPFSGVVARRYVRMGQKVSSGDRLFWVSELSPLRVKFTVAERSMSVVKQGGTVYVSSADESGRVYQAKVLQVSPVVDPASDSVDVLVELDGKPADLRPGMTARISLTPTTRAQ
jgi:HlyD family secretion protein